MIDPADWAKAYAQQADADFKAWELFEKYPEAVAAECHKLLFLQMACEKLCKAHLIRSGSPPDTVQASHGYVANPLPIVIRRQMEHLNVKPSVARKVLEHVRHLAAEIEILNPAVRRDGLRPDNCEYPWATGNTNDATVLSPLSWTFHPSRLCVVPAGRTFLKLLRGAIDQFL